MLLKMMINHSIALYVSGYLADYYSRKIPATCNNLTPVP
jgi:hypothetical protein